MKGILGIIGAGHLGQQIAHYAILDHHYEKVVFFDDYTTEKEVNDFPILGNSEIIHSAYENNLFDELIIGIGYKHLAIRKKMFEQFFDVIPFGKIIHSTTWVDQTSKIKHGCVIYPRCCIDAHVVIDCNTILNISCSVAHNTIVGKHCFVSPNVAMAGFINIKEQCIIGINSTIIDNISIAQKTQIGAGTVVVKNIDKAGLYVGNPQKFIR
jgi:sugar O-acyltransferase (sialic acid O-acetyltransferase NeuD family)